MKNLEPFHIVLIISASIECWAHPLESAKHHIPNISEQGDRGHRQESYCFVSTRRGDTVGPRRSFASTGLSKARVQ